MRYYQIVIDGKVEIHDSLFSAMAHAVLAEEKGYSVLADSEVRAAMQLDKKWSWE